MQFFTPSLASSVRSFPRLGLPILLVLALSTVGLTSRAQAQVDVTPLSDALGLNELETSTADLIRLAEAYCDALRELKTARMTVSTLQSLRPAAVITNLEVQIAQINVQSAESKMLIMKTIVEKQLVAAEAKLEIVKYLETMGEQGAGAMPMRWGRAVRASPRLRPPSTS